MALNKFFDKLTGVNPEESENYSETETENVNLVAEQKNSNNKS